MEEKRFDIDRLGNIMDKGCFICKHQIDEAEIIFENDNVIAFLDAYPATKGYTLVAVKRHMEDITEMSEEEYGEIHGVIFTISKAIKKAFGPRRICLLNSGGFLTHWHFHIIPMYTEVRDHFIDVILKKTILQLSKEERKEMSLQIRSCLNRN